jgi:hypothetical protein
MLRYIRGLNGSRIVLWCYFIWYLSVVFRYFDSSASLWLNSIGIALIIGTGLVLSTAHSGASAVRLDRWQMFRLYLMPFCVSSFAALIKGRGFFLVFHPDLAGNAEALGACAVFVASVQLLKRTERGARRRSAAVRA